MFVGTAIRPPSRTVTPPPPPERHVEAGRNPNPARGGNAPARRTGPPTPPPAPMLTSGKGNGGRPVSALEEPCHGQLGCLSDLRTALARDPGPNKATPVAQLRPRRG